MACRESPVIWAMSSAVRRVIACLGAQQYLTPSFSRIDSNASFQIYLSPFPSSVTVRIYEQNAISVHQRSEFQPRKTVS